MNTVAQAASAASTATPATMRVTAPAFMMAHPSRIVRLAPSARKRSAFTLVELLVVVGVIVIMMSLAIPAMNAIRGGSDFTSELYDISGTLEQARAFAMSNNTYVLVGVMACNGNTSPNAVPQLSGTGRIAMAIVASKDGRRPYQTFLTNSAINSSPNLATAGATISGSGAAYEPATKIAIFNNITIVDLAGGATKIPTTGGMARPPVVSDYDVASTDCVTATPFAWPLGSQISGSPVPQFSFGNPGSTNNVVIEFDPEGSARIISTKTGAGGSSPLLDAIPQEIEIGLEPARGSSASTPPPTQFNGQIAAIQIDGMSGAVHIYRP